MDTTAVPVFCKICHKDITMSSNYSADGDGPFCFNCLSTRNIDKSVDHKWLALEPGERAAIVKYLDEKEHKVYLWGYGTYIGRVVPDASVKGKHAARYRRLGIGVCKLKTDECKVYWEWECYFINETRFKLMFIDIEKWEVITINDRRRMPE